MSWQDVVLAVSNFVLLVALLPLFFSAVFGLRRIEISLVVTGSITGIFLVFISIATIGLGATLGGSVALVTAVMWMGIAVGTFMRRKK